MGSANIYEAPNIVKIFKIQSIADNIRNHSANGTHPLRLNANTF